MLTILQHLGEYAAGLGDARRRPVGDSASPKSTGPSRACRRRYHRSPMILPWASARVNNRQTAIRHLL